MSIPFNYSHFISAMTETIRQKLHEKIGSQSEVTEDNIKLELLNVLKHDELNVNLLMEISITEHIMYMSAKYAEHIEYNKWYSYDYIYDRFLDPPDESYLTDVSYQICSFQNADGVVSYGLVCRDNICRSGTYPIYLPNGDNKNVY